MSTDAKLRTLLIVPNEELNKGCRALFDAHVERFHIKFEENSWGSSVMFQCSGVMSDAVLVSLHRLPASSNVSCRHNGKEILICNES